MTASIQTFRKWHKFKQYEGERLKKISMPSNMNILVNGKIISQRASPMKIKFSTNGFVKTGWPRKLPILKDHAPRKCFTEQEELVEQGNNHIETMIKLRKIFNERNKDRRNFQEKELAKSQTELCENKKQLSKLMNIQSPNIYAIKCMRRFGKYNKGIQKKARQNQTVKSAQSHPMSKVSNLGLSQNDETMVSFGIDAWETE